MLRSMFQVYVTGSDKAAEFYQKAFDAKLVCAYPNEDGTYMHAELDVYGQTLALSESNSKETDSGNTMQFCLHFGEGNADKVYRIYEVLKDVPRVAVLDKAVSLGGYAPLSVDVKAALYGKKKGPKVVSSFVAGLGGRDITLESINEVFRRLTAKEVSSDFIDLKPELLKEEYGR